MHPFISVVLLPARSIFLSAHYPFSPFCSRAVARERFVSERWFHLNFLLEFLLS